MISPQFATGFAFDHNPTNSSLSDCPLGFMISSIIAYLLLVSGFGNTIGLLGGYALSAVVSRLIPMRYKSLLVPVVVVLSGFGAMLAALTLFWLLSLSFNIAIFLIVAFWTVCYCFLFHQRISDCLLFNTGVLLGWACLPALFSNARCSFQSYLL